MKVTEGCTVTHRERGDERFEVVHVDRRRATLVGTNATGARVPMRAELEALTVVEQ